MGEDRKFPIAYIGEEFDWGEFKGYRATVLKVSTNYHTGKYVYKIRNDYPWGEVDEGWCTEREVREMKGMKDVDG